MVDERPYAERPAARPDPNRIKASDAEAADSTARVEAEAAGGEGKPTSDGGGCSNGCLGFFVVAVVIGFIVLILV